jgi:tetratricopeptide (TPR) repeat protein
VTSLVEQTHTDSAGNYVFARMRPGNYLLVARLDGYKEASVEVTVYPRAMRTTVPPITLYAIDLAPPPAASGTVDAAELKLSKECRTSYEKGMRALDKGRVGEARNHLLHVIELEPSFAKGHHYLGVSETMGGNYAEASVHFQRAIELSPSTADSYFGLARSLNLQNRPAEALPIVATGLELEHRSALGLFEKSRAHFLAGDYPSAEETARQAVATVPPPPPEIHLLLANTYIRLRRFANAASELEIYLKLDPTSSSATKAKETLDKIRAAAIPRAQRGPNP